MDAVKDDLQELLALIQTFQRTLSAQGPIDEIEASLHAVRRRLWRTEARIVKLGWPTDLDRRWRTVRERLNAISDYARPATGHRPRDPVPARRTIASRLNREANDQDLPRTTLSLSPGLNRSTAGARRDRR